MRIPYFVVDSFTETPFHGNPAGVCLPETELSAATMQKIAFENNLAETAFLLKKWGGHYALRWFTPEDEVDLCGHATLASAFVLSTVCGETGEITFESQSGTLTAKNQDGVIYLDFPARPAKPVEISAAVAEALGAAPDELYLSRDLLAVFKTEEQVRRLKPDFEKITLLDDAFGLIVTAPGTDSDFVSRFFDVKAAIGEDPVTGSSHCTLIPYWAKRLGKNELLARQVSRRGGTLFCKNSGERVSIGGKAVLYLRGEIEPQAE